MPLYVSVKVMTCTGLDVGLDKWVTKDIFFSHFKLFSIFLRFRDKTIWILLSFTRFYLWPDDHCVSEPFTCRQQCDIEPQHPYRSRCRDLVLWIKYHFNQVEERIFYISKLDSGYIQQFIIRAVHQFSSIVRVWNIYIIWREAIF